MSAPAAATRHGRRRGWVVFAVLILALGALACAADALVRGRIESTIAGKVTSLLPQVDAPRAQVGGALVLPQVISGTLQEVTLTAESFTINGLTARDVSAEATGVHLDEQAGSAIRVTGVHATGTVPTDSLTAVVSGLDLPEGIEISTDGTDLVASGSVLGLVDLELRVAPVARERAIAFDLTSVRVGKAEVGADAIPQAIRTGLLEARIELDDLPAGLRLTDLTVTPQGVDVTLDGSEITLSG